VQRTREISTYAGLEKEYEGTMLLGQRTASFDAECPLLESRPLDGVTEDSVRAAAGRFVGVISQVPPMWSAVKVGETPLYAYARKDRLFDRRPPRGDDPLAPVQQVRLPEVDFTVVCSKERTSRSLVEGSGRWAWVCGAHLVQASPNEDRPYRVSDAWTVDELVASTVIGG